MPKEKNENSTASKKGLGYLFEIFKLLKGEFFAYSKKQPEPKTVHTHELLSWKSHANSSIRYKRYKKDEITSFLNYFANNKKKYQDAQFLSDTEETLLQNHLLGENLISEDQLDDLIDKKGSIFMLNKDNYEPISQEELDLYFKLGRHKNPTPRDKNWQQEIFLKNELYWAKTQIEHDESNLKINVADLFSMAEEYEIIKTLNILDDFFNNNPYFEADPIYFEYGGSSEKNRGSYNIYDHVITLYRAPLIQTLKGNIATAIRTIFHEYDHHLQQKTFESDQTENIINGENIEFDYYSEDLRDFVHDIIDLLYTNLDLIDTENEKSLFVNNLKYLKKKASLNPNYNPEPLLKEIEHDLCTGIYFNFAYEVDARKGGFCLSSKFFENAKSDTDNKKLKKFLNEQQKILSSTKKEEKINKGYMDYFKGFDEFLKNIHSKISSKFKDCPEKETFAIFLNDLLPEEYLEKIINDYETSNSITAQSFNTHLASDNFFGLFENVSPKAFLNIIKNSLQDLNHHPKNHNQTLESIKLLCEYYYYYHLNYSNVFNQQKFDELNKEMFENPKKYKDVISYFQKNNKDFIDTKNFDTQQPQN